MNKEEILAITDLPILNVLIVEDVMGWEERVDFDYVDGNIARYIPNSMDVKKFSPSTDMSDAWEVVNKLNHDGKHLVWHENKKQWCFIFGKGTWGRWSAYGDTAPEAISKAAYIAVME